MSCFAAFCCEVAAETLRLSLARFNCQSPRAKTRGPWQYTQGVFLGGCHETPLFGSTRCGGRDVAQTTADILEYRGDLWKSPEYEQVKAVVPAK